jgi:hypothetical protein
MLKIYYRKSLPSVRPVGCLDEIRFEELRDLGMGHRWYVEQNGEFFMSDLSETHDLVYTDPAPIHDMSLETIFETFQGEFMSNDLRAKFREANAPHTSMSVGDVVVIDGKGFFCDCCGWVAIREWKSMTE